VHLDVDGRNDGYVEVCLGLRRLDVIVAALYRSKRRVAKSSDAAKTLIALGCIHRAGKSKSNAIAEEEL
jgi:hypothetical protein